MVDKSKTLRNEIKILFDNEIISRLGEKDQEKISEVKIHRIKELLFEKMNIENNLTVYEDLMLKNRAIGKNTFFIEGMLNKLKSQKLIIDKDIKDTQEDDAEHENKHPEIYSGNANVNIEDNQFNPQFEFNDEQQVNPKVKSLGKAKKKLHRKFNFF